MPVNFLATYVSMPEIDKIQLIDLATNLTFKSMIAGLIKEVEHDLCNLSPGTDEKEFAMQYALNHRDLERLRDLQEMIAEAHSELIERKRSYEPTKIPI